MTQRNDIVQHDLADLASQIKAMHRKAEDCAREAVGHALEAGKLLIQEKTQIQHGNWLPWLQDNCEVSERTARTYMQLAREYPKLEEPDRQRVANLPLRQAIKAAADCTVSLAKVASADLDTVADRVESKGHGSINRIVREVVRDRKIADTCKADEFDPAVIADGRPASVERNNEFGRWRVTLAADESYELLPGRIEEARKDEIYQGDISEAEELECRAKEFLGAAEEAKKEAREIRAYARQDVADRILRIYGPAKPQ